MGRFLGCSHSLSWLAGSLINYIALLLVVTTVKYFTWFHVCITCVPVFIINYYMDGVFCYLFWCPMTSWNLSLSPNLGGLGLGFHNISTTGFITSLSVLHKTRKVRGDIKRFTVLSPHTQATTRSCTDKMTTLVSFIGDGGDAITRCSRTNMVTLISIVTSYLG